MSVVVTGAAGFIGRNLVRALLDEGQSVLGFDSFITSDPTDLDELLGTSGFTFHRTDVTNEEFRRAAEAADVSEIYHLACPTGVPNLVPMALEMLETSFDGTRAVLEVARAQGATILFASSAEVYGNPTVSPQAEEYTGNVDTLGPRKGYEEGKRVAETLCGIYAERFDVPAKIARIFNTYGPGMSLQETRVIPAFVRRALLDEPLVVHGDGSQLRCHTYVSDTVNGLLQIARMGTAGTAYNLGSQDAKSVRSLAELVVELTDSRSPIVTADRPRHDHDARLPDTSRAASLGWRPEVPLVTGLRATIEDIDGRLSGRGLMSPRRDGAPT